MFMHQRPADVQDAARAGAIAKALRRYWPWLRDLYADRAYDRGKLMSAVAYRAVTPEAVRKLNCEQGLVPLPSRWVVERALDG